MNNVICNKCPSIVIWQIFGWFINKLFCLECWSRCASLPHSLYSAACCAFKQQIFVFGPQVYIYQPSSDNWFIMPEAALPSNMSFNCAMPHGEWIYLTGIINGFALHCYSSYLQIFCMKNQNILRHLPLQLPNWPSPSPLTKSVPGVLKLFSFW